MTPSIFKVESVTRERFVARVRGSEYLPNGTLLKSFDVTLCPGMKKVRCLAEGRDLPWEDERVDALTAAAFSWLLWETKP